jgi:hypothetical protein
MTDHFVFLGLPRRPGIDRELLEEIFVRRSERLHRESRSASDLSALNEAYRILQDPSARIRHLLELEMGTPPSTEIPPALTEIFGSTAEAIQEFDQHYASLAAEPSPVLRAMRVAGLATARRQIELAKDSIDEQEKVLLRELAAIDREWPAQAEKFSIPLARLGSELSFIQKWSNQLRERLLRWEELV